jgi:hypothetical protein
VHSAGLQVPSGAQVCPALQSSGLPQYTTGLEPPEPPAPAPPAPLLLELLAPPAPLLLELLAPPVPLLPPDGSHATVLSCWSVQSKPGLHPQIEQSPGWHLPSLPHVSLTWQSWGP